jgi:uncharacterized membrane protein YkoI
MSRLFGLALLMLACAAGTAMAAQPVRCLGVEERKAAIASNKAVPLSRAVRTARARAYGELVRARLCESGGRLVYLLTLLARDGKVARVTVDAGTGRPIGRR